MAMASVRPWCAIAQYQGLQRFMLGTVVVAADALHDEIIEALRSHALTFLPTGFEIVEPRCGALFFQEGAL